MFAASICIGEVLVAHRQFLYYALAPILYTGGIILGHGPALGHVRDRRLGHRARRRRHGASRHPGRSGTRHTTFRIGIGRAYRTSAFREFIRLMIPRMLSHPIEPLTFTYFTILASTWRSEA